MSLWNREPVAFYTVAIAAVAALTEYGVDMTDGQQLTTLGLVAAVLGLVTRQKVTPWSPGDSIGAA